MRLLSGDPPRGLALRLVLAAVVLALAFAPFLFPGAKALNVAAKICEQLDAPIYHVLGLSGHSIKHVLSAVAVLFVVLALLRIPPPPPRAS